MFFFHILKSVRNIPIKAFLFQSNEVARLLADLKKQIIIVVFKTSPFRELIVPVSSLDEIFLVDQIHNNLIGDQVAIDVNEGIFIL